jgi:anti-anti-sigma factor
MLVTTSTTQVGGQAAVPTSRERARQDSTPFACTATDVKGGVVLHLEGYAGHDVVDEVLPALNRIVARQDPLVVVDLSSLVFLSSLAMWMLMRLRRDLARFQGRVRIACTTPDVYEEFQATRLNTLFEFYDTVDQALAAS